MSVSKKDDGFLVVGLGASAGGLDAFKTFFEAMPDDPGMAFVLVQHLDPTHKSLLVELLQNHTKMQVSEVKDGIKVKPNNVYIIPPNKDMAVSEGKLHLLMPSEKRGFRKPIDFFFRSLADDMHEKAVGIILTGTGTEGALSMKSIKGEGGLTIVQDPKTAAYDGMPRSVVSADAADFVLPIKEMPKHLIEYQQNRKLTPLKKSKIKEHEASELEKIFILLRNETGCNFKNYKSSTISRRVEKRMAINKIDALKDYVKYLQKNREETLRLFKELLIGVTSFFRDKEPFESLEKKIIPQLVKEKKVGSNIRVWVPGCSTGEEAYSIAILLNEELRKQKKNMIVQIFASDIDNNAINIARLGIYPDTIVTDVSEAHLKRYFDSEGNAFHIKKQIRDQIIFAEQNILSDPPFSKLDMVSCRNLLIYLNAEAQEKVISILHYSLNTNGLLFLGNSESLGGYSDMFTTLDRKNKIFAKKNVAPGKKTDIGIHAGEYSITKTWEARSAPKPMHHDNLAVITERVLLAKYAPACAIIDHKNDAVFFSGNTGKYLQPSPGEARLNVLDMAREGLKTGLRSAITRVRKSKNQDEQKDIMVRTNGKLQAIHLVVTPMHQLGANHDYLMITFEDVQDIPEHVNVKSTKKEDRSQVRALEQELEATKEYLRSIVEELEVSNEELQSTNEELQSANEELQSTNEELETSKEELQSVNEEIVTMNGELQSKIEELAELNNDMNNVLASTEIGTIFLDTDMNIKRFTPSMAKIINLIDTDIGRPVDHLSSNLLYDNLENDAQNVLDSLVPTSVQVQSKDGIWYRMQILPYRTTENKIEGVVMTFVDITEEKKANEDLTDIEKKYEHLLDKTQTIVFTQDKDLRYKEVANVQAIYQPKDVIGKTDKDLYSKSEVEKLEKMKRGVLRSGKPDRMSMSLKINNGETRYYDLTVRPIQEDGEVTGIACTFTDITELTEAKLKSDE